MSGFAMVDAAETTGGHPFRQACVQRRLQSPSIGMEDVVTVTDDNDL